MTKVFCDLCGKELRRSPDNMYRYKNLQRGMLESWVYLDAHAECINKLCDTVEENRAKKDILGGN